MVCQSRVGFLPLRELAGTLLLAGGHLSNQIFHQLVLAIERHQNILQQLPLIGQVAEKLCAAMEAQQDRYPIEYKSEPLDEQN